MTARTTRTLSIYVKHALEAFKYSNISVDDKAGTEYGSTTRVSVVVLCLYIAICYKHLHLQYNTIKLNLCGIHITYLRTGVTVSLN